MAKEIKFNIKFDIDGKTVLAACTSDAKELARQLDGVQQAAKQASSAFKAFKDFKKGFDDSIQALDDLTAESNQFAAAMREANTMAGKAGADFDALRSKVAALSTEIPVARDLLAKGLYQVISNGVPEQNWLSYLEASARASVGGLANLEEVVKVTSTVIKNYGLDWSDAQSIQDKIQLTAKNGVTSFEQLAAALPRVTGNAATLGITVDELMASFATLTGVSGNTAEVSTQLAAVMTALVKPSSEATNMAKQMGIEFNASAVKAAGGLKNFLAQLNQSVAQYSQTSGLTAQTIYGKLFGSAEALRALIPLTGELSSKFDDNLQAMAGSAGTIDEAFGTIASSASATVQKVQNCFGQFTDLFAPLYAAVKPTLSVFGQIITVAAQLGTVATSLMKLQAAAKAYAAGMTAAEFATKALKVSLRSLALMGGVTALLYALGAAVGYLIGKYEEWTEQQRQATQALTDEGRAAKQAADVRKTLADVQDDAARRCTDETTKIKTLADTIHNTNQSYQARKQAIEELQRIVPDYHGSLTKEGRLINDNAAAIDNYCKQLTKKATIEAANDKITQIAARKLALPKGQQAWKSGAANIRKEIAAENKRYDDELAKTPTYAQTSGVDEVTIKHNERMAKLNERLEKAEGKVAQYGSEWNTILEEEEQLKSLIQNTMKELGSIGSLGGGGGNGGGTGSGKAKSTTTGHTETITDQLAGKIKPLEIDFSKAHLQQQLDFVNAQLRSGLGTVQARLALQNTAADLQDQINNITAHGERLTIPAYANTSNAYGSTEDKYQSLQNAQAQVQHIQELVDLKIIGQDEASQQLDAINAKLRELGMQPLSFTVQVEADTKQATNALASMQQAWQGVTGISSGIETLTDALEGNGTVWEKVQAVVNGFFSIMQSVQTLLQAFTPATKAAATATQTATAATQAQTAANTSEAVSASGAALGEATKSGAQLPFPANIAAIAAGVAAVVSVIATISSLCFESGGIVGGASLTGDRVPVRVNSGEMILNRRQQATLFRLANGDQRPAAPTLRPAADITQPQIQSLAALTAALSPQQVEVTVRGKITGRDIHLANDRRSRLLSKC